jgi:hypothetical protein
MKPIVLEPSTPQAGSIKDSPAQSAPPHAQAVAAAAPADHTPQPESAPPHAQAVGAPAPADDTPIESATATDIKASAPPLSTPAARRPGMFRPTSQLRSYLATLSEIASSHEAAKQRTMPGGQLVAMMQAHTVAGVPTMEQGRGSYDSVLDGPVSHDSMVINATTMGSGGSSVSTNLSTHEPEMAAQEPPQRRSTLQQGTRGTPGRNRDTRESSSPIDPNGLLEGEDAAEQPVPPSPVPLFQSPTRVRAVVTVRHHRLQGGILRETEHTEHAPLPVRPHQ